MEMARQSALILLALATLISSRPDVVTSRNEATGISPKEKQGNLLFFQQSQSSSPNPTLLLETNSKTQSPGASSNASPHTVDPYKYLTPEPVAQRRWEWGDIFGPTSIAPLLPWFPFWGPHGYFNLCPFVQPGLDPVWSRGCASTPYPYNNQYISSPGGVGNHTFGLNWNAMLGVPDFGGGSPAMSPPNYNNYMPFPHTQGYYPDGTYPYGPYGGPI